MKEVLDTRFFLEHAYSDRREVTSWTRTKLRTLRRRGQGVVPTLVLAELVDYTCRRAGLREARRLVGAILDGGLTIYPVDADVAISAGELRCAAREVPMADCVIAAIAKSVSGRVVSDDPHFKRLPGIRVTWR